MRHLPQRLVRCLDADEVHLQPGGAVLGLHHLGDVVDRTVALDQVEVGEVQVLDVEVTGVPGQDAVDRIADLLEDPFQLPAVPADVVLARGC